MAQKAAIIFLSADLKHDYQQVERMEQEIMLIVQQQLGWKPENWCRFSDNCASQFKSKYTIVK